MVTKLFFKFKYIAYIWNYKFIGCIKMTLPTGNLREFSNLFDSLAHLFKFKI